MIVITRNNSNISGTVGGDQKICKNYKVMTRQIYFKHQQRHKIKLILENSSYAKKNHWLLYNLRDKCLI